MKLVKTILFLALSVNLIAQSQNKLKFEHLTVDDGLSQNTIEKIFQDNQGFIWIATRDGLNKFDGIKFTKYRFDRTDPNSIASSWVSAIAEDGEGNIWIGSLEGLNILDCKTGKLRRVKDDTINHTYVSGNVYDIEVDYDNSLWIGTINGLIHYVPEKKTFEAFRDNLKSQAVFDIEITSENSVYIAVDADPIYKFNRKDKTFSEISYKQKYFGSNYKKTIKEVEPQNLYISSEGAAIHILNVKNNESELLDVGPNHLNSSNVQTAPLKVSPSEIWIGTDGGGINIYNPSTESMSYLKFDPQNQYSISGGAIFDLFQDIHGNIWVGHYGTGISLWKKYEEKFVSYKPSPFDPNAISNGVVTASFEDSKGRIWIGIDGGGLQRFIPETGKFKHYNYDENNPKSLASDIIMSIDEDAYGNLIIGTYAAGIMIFNPETEEMIHQITTKNGLSSNNIWDIYHAIDGRYYLASLGTGIDILNPADSTFEYLHYNNADNPFFSSVPMFITEDSDGNLWYGSEGTGLGIYSLDSEEKHVFQLEGGNLNSLSNNDVKCIVFLDGFAWIATNGGGLNRLDLNDFSFKIFTQKDGLTSNALMGILVDDNKNMWVSSVNGLMKIKPVEDSIIVTSYDKTQGLQGNEFKYNSQFRLKDGRMIFGGLNGINIFNPDSIRPNPIVPNVVFTDFKIMNESVKIGTKKSALKKHINYAKSIVLSHKDRVISIEFSSLDFTSPEKNIFKYMLDGFDDGWDIIENSNSVTYTNLPPGKYTFRLIGSNSDGHFLSEERNISFKVKPPWYKTNIFILFVFLLVFYIIFLFIKRRDETTKKEKELLQKKIDDTDKKLIEKERELEKKVVEFDRKTKDEYEVNFQYQGLAKFSDIISKERRDISSLSRALITELVQYSGANAGVIYIPDDSDPQNIILRKSGDYSFDTDSEKEFDFHSGEGYIGTCFVEKKTLIIENLPKNYIKLKSGLGETSIKHDLIVPVLLDNECMGILEIASIEKLPQFKVEFIEKVADNFGSVIAITKANEKTKEMLEQNEQQSQELQAQEEELRQNLEEMQATQEELTRQMEKNKKANDALKKEQALIDSLLKFIPENIYFKDKESRFIKASNSMAVNFKVKNVEEIYGKSDFDFYTEEHAKPAFDDEQEIIRSGKPMLDKIEKETHTDGSVRYVSTSKMPLYDDKGDIIGTFGITKDITESYEMQAEVKQRNEELLAQEEELRQNLEEMHATQEELSKQIEISNQAQAELSREKTLIDTMLKYIPDNIYFKDKDSKFIKASQSMAKNFKANNVEEIYGKSDFDYYTEEHARPAFEDEQEIIRTGKPIINKIEKETHNDGSIRYVSTTKMPLYEDSGKIIGTFGISKDVTEAYEKEAEIKQRNEELLAQEEELRQNLEEMQSIQENLEEQVRENNKIQKLSDELIKKEQELVNQLKEKEKTINELKSKNKK
ncbi:MAG: PAS domain-containing protein [Bacteroidales bacterium]|nr:PAS domain-containing protein [Bacteroidales bacterium]MBN2819644.1 PAS domain-containing protein [Bacteroidales bacterium]